MPKDIFWHCAAHIRRRSTAFPTSLMYALRTTADKRITKTYLYNFDPLNFDHFHTVKLGFTGVLIYLISALEHRLWVRICAGWLKLSLTANWIKTLFMRCASNDIDHYRTWNGLLTFQKRKLPVVCGMKLEVASKIWNKSALLKFVRNRTCLYVYGTCTMLE